MNKNKINHTSAQQRTIN